MKTSKKNKVHVWTHAHMATKGRYYKYRCTRCGLYTLSGIPLRPPYDEECRPGT